MLVCTELYKALSDSEAVEQDGPSVTLLKRQACTRKGRVFRTKESRHLTTKSRLIDLL
jgi:hypothetical protein